MMVIIMRLEVVAEVKIIYLFFCLFVFLSYKAM